MTKFIKSLALRFANCADFLDEMNDATHRTQRAHAIELQQQMTRNARQVVSILENASVPAPLSAAKRALRVERTARKRTRAQERHAKHLRQQAMLAE